MNNLLFFYLFVLISFIGALNGELCQELGVEYEIKVKNKVTCLRQNLLEAIMNAGDVKVDFNVTAPTATAYVFFQFSFFLRIAELLLFSLFLSVFCSSFFLTVLVAVVKGASINRTLTRWLLLLQRDQLLVRPKSQKLSKFYFHISSMSQ